VHIDARTEERQCRGKTADATADNDDGQSTRHRVTSRSSVNIHLLAA
jgi:hypothetical protein